MALSRVKTWVAGEVLFAADLNAEFNNVLNNPMSLISPWTANLDADGFDLLDLDELEFRDAAANATAAGRLRRNSGNLTWHDGTSARTVTLLETAQTISGVKTFSAAPVIAVEDARTNSVATFLTVRGTTTGAPAAGIGSSILVQAESGDENPSDFGRLDFLATDVGAGTEDTVLGVLLRVAGAALTEVYRLQATGAFLLTITHALTAGRTLTIPDATTTMVGTDTTQTLTNKTLTSPTISGASLSGTTSVAASGVIVPAAVSGTPAQHGIYQENVVKVWANVSATPSLNDSFNMTSVADAGAGLITITFDRDFANATYAVVGSATGTVTVDVAFDSLAVGSVVARTFNEVGSLTDTAFTFLAIGDQ